MHGTELLQMSCSTKQDYDMRSKLVIWLLQPIVFSLRQNNSRSYFASWGKIDKAQKYMLCIIIPFSDSFRIQIVWFQPKQDSDRIWISFFINKIGSDSKNHYAIISVTSIYVLDLRGKCLFICNNKIFFLCFFSVYSFCNAIFFHSAYIIKPPQPSSTIYGAPLFTGNQICQESLFSKKFANFFLQYFVMPKSYHFWNTNCDCQY